MDRDTFFRFYRASKYGKQAGKTLDEFAKVCHYEGFISEWERQTGIADPCTLDIDKVRLPIIYVWSQVASDMEHNAEAGAFELTNIVAIEVCLDCNNLTNFWDDLKFKPKGSEASEALIAQAEIDKAQGRFGYDKVLRYLARNIQLV